MLIHAIQDRTDEKSEDYALLSSVSCCGMFHFSFACLPACLLACLPACLLACLPACLLACWAHPGRRTAARALYSPGAVLQFALASAGGLPAAGAAAGTDGLLQADQLGWVANPVRMGGAA